MQHAQRQQEIAELSEILSARKAQSEVSVWALCLCRAEQFGFQMESRALNSQKDLAIDSKKAEIARLDSLLKKKKVQ